MLFRSRSFLEAIAICNKEAHYLPDGRVLFLPAIYFCQLSLFYFCKLVVPAQLHSANIRLTSIDRHVKFFKNYYKKEQIENEKTSKNNDIMNHIMDIESYNDDIY